MTALPTYEIVKAAEPAMAWAAYETIAAVELNALLTSGECDERRFQELLERHPSLVPSSWEVFRDGHHGTFPVALIAQPTLTGLSVKHPDFMWISRDSLTTYAVLIEIESPCKKWFTLTGHAHHELTRAIDQLKEWQLWFSSGSNRDRFLSEYRVPDAHTRAFEQRYVLIYGRRAELEGDPNNLKRAALQKDGEVFMTWDRVAPNAELDDVMTVGIDGAGYFAKSVPPTISIRPMFAYERSLVRGKEEATAASPLLSDGRKQFLIDRWKYWDDWATKNRSYFGRLQDSE